MGDRGLNRKPRLVQFIPPIHDVCFPTDAKMLKPVTMDGKSMVILISDRIAQSVLEVEKLSAQNALPVVPYFVGHHPETVMGYIIYKQVQEMADSDLADSDLAYHLMCTAVKAITDAPELPFEILDVARPLIAQYNKLLQDATELQKKVPIDFCGEPIGEWVQDGDFEIFRPETDEAVIRNVVLEREEKKRKEKADKRNAKIEAKMSSCIICTKIVRDDPAAFSKKQAGNGDIKCIKCNNSKQAQKLSSRWG